MHDTLSLAATRDMMAAVAERMVASTELLTAADQAIGDGDHGIGMRRGFAAVLEMLRGLPAPTIQALVKSVGTTLMARTGGAAGAIFGTFFTAGSAAFADSEVVDGAGFARFLMLGLAAVEKRGGAREGQKTMIDALAPAVRAAMAGSQALPDAVRAAAVAAAAGVEATRQMIATTGKAKTLGERSLGHPDPGALSLSLILAAMQDFVLA
jgi:phosphoenolpyruvate---glycerone phosphotransferase subunit DhaL